MSAELQSTSFSVTAWPRNAVFALDRWLRGRMGIYEYTASRECLFRIQRGRADRPFVCSDGVFIRRGDPILVLHLWNEHMPAMGRDGPTLAWASRASRAVHRSLRELADYLRARAEYDDIAALYGDMCVSTAAQGEQLARIVPRYGFEVAPGGRRSGVMHHSGESILNFMLVLATNPAALRGAILRPYRQRVIYSRAVLERRYGGTHPPRIGRWRRCRLEYLAKTREGRAS